MPSWIGANEAYIYGGSCYAMEEPRWVEWETQKGLFFYGVFLKGRREEAYPAYDA